MVTLAFELRRTSAGMSSFLHSLASVRAYMLKNSQPDYSQKINGVGGGTAIDSDSLAAYNK